YCLKDQPDRIDIDLPEYYYNRYEINGDTVIDSKQYKKMLYGCPQNQSYFGAFREQDKKVFFIENNSGNERLVYDFSLNTGDTFVRYDGVSDSYIMIVSSIDTINIGGGLRKRINFVERTDYNGGAWIEGIGDMKSILTLEAIIAGQEHWLNYKKENGEIVYRNSESWFNENDCDEREYIPLLNSGNRWNQILQSAFGDFAMTYVTKLGSDTLINDTSYYKLLTTRDSLASIWLDNGYIREDTQNRKVYYRLGDSLEILLYDFSAKVGDTIRTHDFHCDKRDVVIIVKDTSEVLIGSKLHKQINVHVLSSNPENYEHGAYREHIWIEGIGDISGLLKSTEYLCPSNSTVEYLLCFLQNEELVYKSERSDVTDCFVWYDEIVNIEQSTKHSDIAVFPNPADGYLILTSLTKTISLVEIFNVSGHKVYSQSHGNTIDISSFSKGMYLLKVYDNSGRVSTFKIVKK
ncbi:MAG: T9SS type A sorting domain-containing protein, partial [Bacteroidales bacterium]|nr:T9SS type A sorting domain-containing protein [Bacteroidales bacterium]